MKKPSRSRKPSEAYTLKRLLITLTQQQRQIKQNKQLIQTLLELTEPQEPTWTSASAIGDNIIFNNSIPLGNSYGITLTNT